MKYTIAQFIPIIIIVLILWCSDIFVNFSHSILGKILALLIIIFYTSINKILGLVICLLIIVYYQSDFVQNLLNTDENMENIIAIDNKFKLYDNYEQPETDNDFSEDVEKPVNKSEKVQNIISWLEDVYTLGDNKKDLEINKVQDTFRKENCKDNQLMHKNMPVKPEMTEHVFNTVEFKGQQCNVCDVDCDFSIIENRLKKEKELFSKFSKDENFTRVN